MKRKKIDWVYVAAFICFMVLVASMLLAMAGCSFARKLDKTETKKDTVAVSSIDSNWLKKVIEQNSNIKQSGSELRIYQPPNTPVPDVNNYFTTPGTDNSGLLAILTSWQHEQGNSQRLTVDSGNLAKDDSSAVKVDTSEKKTDTSAKTPLMMWIMLGVIIVMALKMFGGPVVSYFIGKAGYSKSNNT